MLVRYGESTVLVTAVMSDAAREGIDFLPLTVDYMEKAYAAGPGPRGLFPAGNRPPQRKRDPDLPVH